MLGFNIKVTLHCFKTWRPDTLNFKGTTAKVPKHHSVGEVFPYTYTFFFLLESLRLLILI